MKYDDRPDPAIRLEKARIKRGFGSATEAANYFGWNRDTYFQHENGTRGIIRAAKKYAKAFRVSEGWLLTGQGESPATVPLVGYVGAASEWFPIDDHANGAGLDDVPAPPDCAKNVVAVKVRGDSMFPRYNDGEVLYYAEPQEPPAKPNPSADYVIWCEDGRVLVKRLLPGSQTGLYHLQSVNPAISIMLDIPVRQVAKIIFVRPI